MNIMKILTSMIVFALGFISCVLLVYGLNIGKEIPKALGLSQETSAPGDWIKENMIHVYENAIVIDLDKASLSSYAATGSMKPVLDENSNGIRIVPENENQLKMGDIVTYERENELIVHRIIETGEDSLGKYYITKGDNNSVNDGKVRFSEIKYVTIGILY